jgi:hypothetical protein
MSRRLPTPHTAALAALAVALASAGCGTASQPLAETAAAHATRPPAPLDGLYTAAIAGRELRTAVPGVHLPAGTWALRIDLTARTLRLIPPEGGDITLRVEAVDASLLRLAPDTACESRAGRAISSRFAWSRRDGVVRLQAVRAPCRSLATMLTTAPWRPAWPTTSLATSR